MSKLLVPLFLVLAVSCQKKNEQHRMDWQKGSPVSALKQIEQQEWSEKTTESIQKDSKIVITQQSFMGFPIEGSYLKKLYLKEKDGFELFSATSQYFTPPEFKALRGLSFDENTILKRLKNLKSEFSVLSVISGGTVLLNLDQRLEPMYKISFFDRRGEPWTAYADQKNNLLKVIREGSHFNEVLGVESQIFPMGPKLSSLTDIVFDRLNVKPTLSNDDVVVTSEAESKILQLDQSIKFDPRDTRFDQVQAFYYLNKSLQWMKDKFSLQFSSPLEVVVHVGFPEKTNTAFYYQSKIRLGTGDDEVYTHISQDPTIVTHESFHYMIDHVAGLPYEGEGGSLNEAFADFFTCLIYERPRLAENAYLKAPFKRTLESETKFADRNGGLYHDSLIVSGLLWEISKKIGSDKSLALAMDVLKKTHRFTTFEEFRTVLNEVVQNTLSKQDVENVKLILGKEPRSIKQYALDNKQAWL